jgi:hypothetical protein
MFLIKVFNAIEILIQKKTTKQKVEFKFEKQKLKLIYIYLYPIGLFFWKILLSKILVYKINPLAISGWFSMLEYIFYFRGS